MNFDLFASTQLLGYSLDIRGSISCGGRDFCVLPGSRSAIKPYFSYVQWIPGFFPRGLNWQRYQIDPSSLSGTASKNMFYFSIYRFTIDRVSIMFICGSFNSAYHSRDYEKLIGRILVNNDLGKYKIER